MAAGRPRSFDVDEALEQAMKVFWEKGYEGASLPDLTEAMGINRPSLYAAFGNKEALFRKAIDRYNQKAACHVHRALEEPNARRVVEHLLLGNIDLITDGENPRGCFIVQSALACGDTAEPVRAEMVRQREQLVDVLRRRFERAIQEGDLPDDREPADWARFVTTLSFGLAVHAAGGATASQLRRIVEIALRAWPS